MRNIILTALFVLFLSSCGIARHSGKIETFDAKGNTTGTYIATLDTRMLMEVSDSNGVTVKVDSRHDSTLGQIFKSVIEFATLGLLMDK